MFSLTAHEMARAHRHDRLARRTGLGLTLRQTALRQTALRRTALRRTALRRTALGLLSIVLLAACGGRSTRDREAGGDVGNATGGNGDIGAGGHVGFLNVPQPEFDLRGAPLYSRVIPLANRHWARSVQTILNLPEPAAQAKSFLAPVNGITLFDNNESILLVNDVMRVEYQNAAAAVAADQLADPSAIARIRAGSEAETFIRRLGRRAYRRPLNEEEVGSYLALFEIGAGLSGEQSAFEKGANLVIEGMLQSPKFLYRSELSPEGEPLTGFEVLSKLSFWILGTSPDDALLDRAALGEFDQAAGIVVLAEEMLADPRAAEMIVDLYSQLFSFDRYRDVVKMDPMWTPELNGELEVVSKLFFEYIYENELGLDEILTSTQGFVGPRLAQFYGISPAPSVPTLQELGAERPGYFSQVPFQMVMGDGSHSDAIHRGLLLNLEVMCAILPSPPAPSIPPLPLPEPGRTDRQRVEEQTGIGTCGEGCHSGYINPLGYAFENFDGLGRIRTIDNGQAVDTRAAYPFAVGEDDMVAFDGAPDLMPLIAGSQEAHACFAKSLMSYALARDIIIDDQALMLQLAEVSRSENGSIKQILRQLVQSPSFLSRPGVAK